MRNTQIVRWIQARAGVLLVIFVFSAYFAENISAQNPPEIVVGTKAFTENVTLGDIARLRLQRAGVRASLRADLGGTRILWNALLSGDIDVYPEYTGTILQEILSDRPELEVADLDSVLATFGVGMTPPLGFNNTYAVGMRREQAMGLGVERISDLRSHTDLVYGFSNEFLDRGDGWRSLADTYGLGPDLVRGMQHDLAYRALENGAIDVTDLYSTDAEIKLYDLTTLEDDRNHFPRYDAVYLYRLDLARRAPDATAALTSLSGLIDAERMSGMNADVKIDGKSSAKVATQFLNDLNLREAGASHIRTQPYRDDRSSAVSESRLARIAGHTRDHLYLVLISLTAAILLALPLGILAARNRRAGSVILGVVGMIYTIPALALLVFMIPLLGIGGPPAIVALFLYSLLPIVRNTHSGLTTISRPVRESAAALGLPDRTRLLKIDLPLASPAILAGIKTSAVINIGTATLGALIGAGGLGQPILTGIRLADTGLILEGAVPAAFLALAAQGLFDLSERWLVPKGLRLSRRI